MENPLGHLDEEGVRRVATHRVRALEVSQAAANEQMLKSSGWLTAALLALNAGGALATINAMPQLDQPFWPSVCFMAGIVFVMLSAVTIQELSNSVDLDSIVLFWREVEVHGIFDPELHTQVAQPVTKKDRWSWLAPFFGWISGLLFLAGAAVLGLDAARPSDGLVARCLSLQQDMLRLPPDNPESRELFETLSCKFDAQARVTRPTQVLPDPDRIRPVPQPTASPVPPPARGN